VPAPSPEWRAGCLTRKAEGVGSMAAGCGRSMLVCAVVVRWPEFVIGAYHQLFQIEAHCPRSLMHLKGQGC
jgi:hypothetical protein